MKRFSTEKNKTESKINFYGNRKESSLNAWISMACKIEKMNKYLMERLKCRSLKTIFHVFESKGYIHYTKYTEIVNLADLNTCIW